MDFAKQLLQEENVTTQSGVCFLPLPKDGSQDEEGIEQHVNHLVIKAANKAASDLFLSSGSKITSTFHKRLKPGSAPSSAAEEKSEEEMDPNKRQLINCKLYKTQMLPPSSKILPNSLVVIFESFDSLDFVYASPGQVFHNRNGDFHHDDFIGKPFGCKIRSRNKRGLGFVYLLKPTPELWARSLNHRTQIVHELDASVVVFNLNLRPNMVVCESGTGSGAMSHCILRTIAPFGTLHTYEFNGMRAKTAREEFKRNKADHLVTVHWRDVCGKEESLAEEVSRETETTQEEGDEDLTYGSGGFDIGPAAAHAIFLDLPQPELAIPHAAHTLKPNGGLCSYSPCVEQSQRTVQAMKKYGFHSIKTIEVRLREHYVDKVVLEQIPTEKMPREPNINPFVPGNGGETSHKKDDVNSTDEKENTKSCEDVLSQESIDREMEEVKEESSDVKQDSIDIPSKRRKLLCARPFPNMRGHTAFLTFAHAGNKAYPDPREVS